jgi:quercetin dioxygenase-like cupin family protein
VDTIEIFRADTPPNARLYSDHLTAGIVRGNMGSLVVIRLGQGAIEEHAHEQEHVGAVLEGEFSFTDGERETVLRAGDLYRVPPNVRHGVRCPEHALIVQARNSSP